MDTLTSFRIKRMSPQLLVTDIDRSLAFYTKKMGFDIDFRYEDFYAGLLKDGCSIHLKSGENASARKSQEDLHLTFSVDNIKDVFEDMISKAVNIQQPLREMPYGKEFYVADPDGNIIAFMEV